VEVQRDRADRPSSAPLNLEGKSLFEALLNRTLGRRRRILIHTGYQLRSALLGITGPCFLLALMIFILDRFNAQSSKDLIDMAPFLRASLLEKDRSLLTFMIVGGIFVAAGMFLLEILESHKTAGVLHNVKRRLEELRAGRFTASVSLRRHDHFQELATTFNHTTASLRARTEGELATLRRLVSQVSELLRENSAGNRPGVLAAAESLRTALQDLQRRKADLLQP